MAAPIYNVYVGSETGLFKGINVFKGVWNNINSITTPDKAKEICSLSWADHREIEICVGLKNKSITTFDVSTNTFSEPTLLDGGKGSLRHAFKLEDSYMTAIDTGLVHIWKDNEPVAEINCGDHLHSLAINHFDRNIFGTGGKETDLKIWDVNNTETPTFCAKNVRNDWLNLRVPVWITGINFLDTNKIITSTGHHQVRVYEPKCQRRPVLDMTFDEYPLTAMSVYRDNQVIVGNTQGQMALLDIRKGQLVHKFKGFAGSIRSVICHANKAVVASCGLDRFLRVHDINSKQTLHKIYLKSRLNCLLLSKTWSDDSDVSQIRDTVSEDVSNEIEEVSDADDDSDDIWDNMEVVQTRTVKTSERNSHTRVGSKRKVKNTNRNNKKMKNV